MKWKSEWYEAEDKEWSRMTWKLAANLPGFIEARGIYGPCKWIKGYTVEGEEKVMRTLACAKKIVLMDLAREIASSIKK